MYSRFHLVKKYSKYWLSASNGKGHGVHSPFVFELITQVLNDNGEYYCYAPIESLRRKLKNDHTILELEDFGAGSRVHTSYKRKISDIANSSLKQKKFAQLLFRMVNHYQPKNVLELGTSLGITTSYLASANKNISVITMEGAKQVASVARKNFETLDLENVSIVEGNFDERLRTTLNKNFDKVDFAFVDGNHRKEPTIEYFKQLLPYSKENSIFIFDDIHWSKEMEDAWEFIKSNDAVTLTIDLFFIGIVFFRNEQKIKQHFNIRF